MFNHRERLLLCCKYNDCFDVLAVQFDFVFEVVFWDALLVAGDVEGYLDLQARQQKSVTVAVDGLDEEWTTRCVEGQYWKEAVFPVHEERYWFWIPKPAYNEGTKFRGLPAV